MLGRKKKDDEKDELSDPSTPANPKASETQEATSGESRTPEVPTTLESKVVGEDSSSRKVERVVEVSTRPNYATPGELPHQRTVLNPVNPVPVMGKEGEVNKVPATRTGHRGKGEE